MTIGILAGSRLIPHHDLRDPATRLTFMGKHDAELRALYGDKADFVPLISQRPIGRFRCLGDFFPIGTGPVLDDIRFGSLHTASVIVNRQLDAPELGLPAEVDFQSIRRRLRFVAGPPVGGIRQEVGNAVVGAFHSIEPGSVRC